MKSLFNITLLALILSATGCSWFGGDDESAEDETAGFTEKDFYERIEKSLRSSNYQSAIRNLQLLESSFPFGRYAEQAQLELIYAYHQSGQHEEAIAAADRFLRLHPLHPNVDYAYYLKGLSQYEQTAGLLEGFLPTDSTQRDTSAARNAFATFSEMLSRYPESTYAADVHKRMIHLRNLFARAEIHAANYYFKVKAYNAAYNRGRYVVENFESSPAVADGLAVMAQALYMMEEPEQAALPAKVLATNFPNYPTLDKDGNFDYEYYKHSGGFALTNLLTLGLYSRTKAPEFDTRDLYNKVYQEDEE